MGVKNVKGLDFTDKPDIYRLEDIPKGYLQVLLPEFTLSKTGDKEADRLIDLVVHDNLPAIISGRGKNQFFSIVRDDPSQQSKLQSDLYDFEENPEILSRRFDCSSYPLRYGNGGVLPIIRWKKEDDSVEEYFCFFYRDIFPAGWNIANGASDSMDELTNPELILLREFGEELLIRDDENKIVYSFNPGKENDPGSTPSKALKAWEKEHNKISSYTTLSVPMTWIIGSDSVRVRWKGGMHESGGYFLNIVPEDNAIEVDRIALINVSGDIKFFDGEQTRGITLNRAVGLFNTRHFRDLKDLEIKNFRPDLIFYDGLQGDPGALEDIVRKKIEELKSLPSPFRTKEDQEKWEMMTDKLDLCPITRRMVKRYIERQGHEGLSRKEINRQRVNEQYEIFISYNSGDKMVAKELHYYLESCGLKSFLSMLSIPQLGESDYAYAIDQALESSKCLVVIGTHPESFDSGWVGYEWRSFLNEIRSGRKKGCQLYTFVSGVTMEQLPFALRSYQTIPFNTSSLQDAFEGLTRYLKQVLINLDVKPRT